MKKYISDFLNCLEALRYLQDHKNDTGEERKIYIQVKKGDYQEHYLEYNEDKKNINEVKIYDDSEVLYYLNKIMK